MTSTNTGSRNDWRDAVWASDLAPNPRLVALAYADHANTDAGAVWVTLARGMKRTGMKRHDTWSKAVAELVTAGWLVEVEARTNKRAARYRLTIPECAERAPKSGVHESRTLDCAERAPQGAQNVHQTPTRTPTRTPAASPADAAECSPAVISPAADEWDEMDALEAQDPHCFALALHQAIETLGPYEVDRILAGHDDARHDDLNALTIAAYDEAHPWETDTGDATVTSDTGTPAASRRPSPKQETDESDAAWLARQLDIAEATAQAAIDAKRKNAADRGNPWRNVSRMVRTVVPLDEWSAEAESHKPVPRRITLAQCDSRDPHEAHRWTQGPNLYHCMGEEEWKGIA